MKYMDKDKEAEKLTMKEINSLLTTYFFAQPASGAKTAHVKELVSEVNTKPNVLTDAYALLVSSGAVAKEKNATAKKTKKSQRVLRRRRRVRSEWMKTKTNQMMRSCLTTTTTRRRRKMSSMINCSMMTMTMKKWRV